MVRKGPRGTVLVAVLVAGSFAVYVMCGVALSAQEPLRFEVASVRPSPSQPVGPIGLRVTQSEVRATFASLKSYIGMAFDLRDHQVDGPQWLSATRFDLVAKRPERPHGLDQIPGMMQALLVDRFRLRTHWATRELPVYGLELLPQGPALTRKPDEAPPEGPFTALSGPGGGGRVQTFGDGSTLALGDNRFEATRMTMARLSDTLTQFVDRPIVNLTQLEGRYDVVFTLTPEDFLAMMRRPVAAAGFVVPGEDLQRLDTASTVIVQDALQRVGLRLRPQRAPIEVLVVDSVNRVPTDN